MITEKPTFESLLSLIKGANEKNSKIKDKINFQKEEIIKTKGFIIQFEDCLKQQNDMLNKLLDEKLTIKNFKNDLFKKISMLENSDDEGFENVFDNHDNDDRVVQINSINTYQNNLDNNKQIDYTERNITDMDTPINNISMQFLNKNKVLTEYRCQRNLNKLTNDNVEPIKTNLESSATNDRLSIQSSNNESMENNDLMPSKNYENSLKRKFITLKAEIHLPKNRNRIFKDKDFIKNYSPKIVFRLKEDIVVDMVLDCSGLYVCCEKGILLKYNQKKKKWTKRYTGSSKTISQYMAYKKGEYLFCENEFIIFNESKTEVKQFDSNIVSNMRRMHNENTNCYISLENGEIWKYDTINEKYFQLFTFDSKMKTCINLSNNLSIFVTNDRKVFTTTRRCYERISKLDGCLDFLASYGAIVVCSYENGICKIYNTVSKKIFELETSDAIKLVRHSQTQLAVLDVQNRLHLYNFMKKSFNYVENQVIQIPTTKNIYAISDIMDKKIYITIENEIYLIKFN